MSTFSRRTLVVGGLIITTAATAYGLLDPAVQGGQSPAAPPLQTSPSLGEKWLGDENAPVTIIEYASATCPHCAAFHAETYPALKREFIDTGQVRLAMREFPFDQLSLAAFMLARCAPEERYFGVIDLLFERQREWTGGQPKAELFAIAKLAGFGEKQFEACLKNEEIARGIIATKDHAAQQLGVDSTPTFFVNGTKYTGNRSIDFFRKLIGSLAG